MFRRPFHSFINIRSSKDCDKARQYLCIVSEAKYREITNGTEKGMAFQGEMDKEDKSVVEGFMGALESGTTAADVKKKAGLTELEKQAKKEAAAARKQALQDKLSSDVEFMVSTWLNGIGKDLVKASQCTKPEQSLCTWR